MALYVQNISNTAATVITGSTVNKIESMIIANTHASNAVTIDLYLRLKESPNTLYYILNNTVIPNGASLMLSRDEIKYNIFEYDLYIVGSSGDLSIIMN